MILNITRYCLLVLATALILGGCTGGGKPVLLKYDDGVMEGKYSLTDTGYAIFFRKPHGNWAIKGVRFYAIRQGSGMGDNINIVMTICDTELKPIAEATVRQNLVDETSEKWRAVNVNPYILCPDEFWVILDCNSNRDSMVFVGTDATTEEVHSKTGEVGGPLSDLDGSYNWMIRVELKKLNKEELDRLVGNKEEEPEV
jgi:hypothetical protein